MGDLVITPALGVAWMVSEDVIDAQILKRMDGQQIVLRNTLRFLLNPSRGPRGGTGPGIALETSIRVVAVLARLEYRVLSSSVPAPGVLFVQGEWACFSFATSCTARPAKCRPMSRSSSAYRSSPQKKGEGPEPHATFRTRRTPSSAITTSTPSVTTDIRISA